VKEERVGISCDTLEVVYTPLNGAGNKPVRRVLEEIGVGKVHVVPEQEHPDGNFPTCPSPNPEKEETLHLGLSLCLELKTPDLLLATDPDCDRLSVAVRQQNEKTEEVSFTLLSGNEVGILLLDFISANKPMPERPVVIKTVVSSKMADEVAKQYGIQMINVLTGFKFIGEQIGILESKGEGDRYIFGFEESSGYLSGPYVRDKDAVNAAMLVCEAASFYKTQGKTLVDRMEELYSKHGYYINALLEFNFEGASGMEKMSEFLELLRSNPPFGIAGEKIVEIADYMTSQRRILGKSCAMSAGYRPIKLPKSDVLEFILADGSSMIVRPSGTEPKLKIYLSAKASTRFEAETVIEDMSDTVRGWV
jgi:phosphoglucomutase